MVSILKMPWYAVLALFMCTTLTHSLPYYDSIPFYPSYTVPNDPYYIPPQTYRGLLNNRHPVFNPHLQRNFVRQTRKRPPHRSLRHPLHPLSKLNELNSPRSFLPSTQDFSVPLPFPPIPSYPRPPPPPPRRFHSVDPQDYFDVYFHTTSKGTVPHPTTTNPPFTLTHQVASDGSERTQFVLSNNMHVPSNTENWSYEATGHVHSKPGARHPLFLDYKIEQSQSKASLSSRDYSSFVDD